MERADSTQEARTGEGDGGGSTEAGAATAPPRNKATSHEEIITKEYARVAKKQKLAYTKTQQCLDQLIAQLETTLKQIAPKEGATSEEEEQGAWRLPLMMAHQNLKKADLANKVKKEHREYHQVLSKFTRAVDKALSGNVAKAYRADLPLDRQLLNEAIVLHLYREGRFDIAEQLEKETNVSISEDLKELLHNMYQILNCMDQKNVEPALKWAEARRDTLSERGSSLEFDLHKLRFTSIVLGGNRMEALSYARTQFPPFADIYSSQVQRLVTSLLFADRIYNSPYADMYMESNWEKVKQRFVHDCCSLLGLPETSPLPTIVKGGCAILPEWIKMAEIMQNNKLHPWSSLTTLPVNNEYKELHYHSLFFCPVSKESCTSDNPPMLLICGHIISKTSLNKLPTRGTRARFKCPYCPTEQTEQNNQDQARHNERETGAPSLRNEATSFPPASLRPKSKRTGQRRGARIEEGPSLRFDRKGASLMVSRLFSALGDVLAPPVKSPLEDFRNHWRAIRHFYIDERDDVEGGEIMHHLNAMVRLLVEEGDEQEKEGIVGRQGPCLDYFLEERILQTWCALAERDTPPGVRKHVLVVLASVLSNSSSPLLHHMSVNRPLCKLLRHHAEMEHAELLNLIFILIKKLREEDSTLISFFFHFPEITEDADIEENSNSIEFPLFSGLVSRMDLEGFCGEQARHALLYCLQYFHVPIVTQFIVTRSTFPARMSELLGTYYEHALNVGEEQLENAMARFLEFLQFVFACLEQSEKDVQTLLTTELHRSFFETALAASLIQPEPEVASKAMSLLSKIIEESSSERSSPIFTRALLSFLFSDNKPSDNNETAASSHNFLRTTLVRRMDSVSERLSLHALSLFNQLFEMRDDFALRTLVLCDIHPLDRFLSSSEEQEKDIEFAVFMPPSSSPSSASSCSLSYLPDPSTIAAFLKLFPVCDSPSDGYDSYLSEAQTNIMASLHHHFHHNSLSSSESASNTTKVDSSHPSSPALKEGEPTTEPLFFWVLFNRLARFLDHSMESLLLLTNIITKLACYPDASLHTFLLHPTLCWRPQIRTLYNVMKQVSNEAEEKCKRKGIHVPEELRKAREQLSAQSLSKEEKAQVDFIQNLLIFEEFCKELSACGSLWSLLMPFSPHRHQPATPPITTIES
ncbi:Regulator of gluconeogenesis Rmd5 [Balamuthia mandrillaris]